MLKKNFRKFFIAVGIIIAILVISLLVGGSFIDIVKDHLGI